MDVRPQLELFRPTRQDAEGVDTEVVAQTDCWRVEKGGPAIDPGVLADGCEAHRQNFVWCQVRVHR